MKQKQKRDVKAERAARYKAAFDEVIGDPFGHPEPIDGCYMTLRSGSPVKIGGTDVTPTSSSPVNEGKPNAVDFFCDVEAAIKDGLDVWEWREDLTQKVFVFQTTYFTEDPAYYQFTQKERAELEQHIGRILVARKISPVPRYFTIIK
jgi:hypothetical protein